MRVLITCGPSYEPLDAVRRLTNFSTGALGVGLAEYLAAKGNEVVCLKGVGAVHPDPARPVQVDRFATNEDLEGRLEHWARTGSFAAVFHVAALCDYRVEGVEGIEGRYQESGKLSSAAGALNVRLVPTRKLIADLRRRFPRAWIVGWKYEVEGTLEDAVQQGVRQMRQHRTDACVVNGPACGSRLVLCEGESGRTVCADRPALLACLEARLREVTAH